VIGSSVETSFTDLEVVSGGTYTYWVSAFDAAVNESARSNPATVTLEIGYTTVETTLTSPAPNSTLTGATETFSWTQVSGATAYWLYIGTSVGTRDILSRQMNLKTSTSVTGLPTDGSTLHIRVWYQVNGAWQSRDYTVTAAKTNTVQACIVTGCSGQICAEDEVTTTCEFRSEYACYQNAICERQSDNQCGWTQTTGLLACIADLSADTTPPSTPTGLTATFIQTTAGSANATESTILLSWNISTDNVGVVGYVVYRDGARVAAINQVEGSIGSYTDSTNITTGNTYIYQVSALDMAGNESARSDKAVVLTEVSYSQGTYNSF